MGFKYSTPVFPVQGKALRETSCPLWWLPPTLGELHVLLGAVHTALFSTIPLYFLPMFSLWGGEFYSLDLYFVLVRNLAG